MSGTISTWELNKLTVSSALNVQTQLSQAEVQESSGLVAQDFATLGGSNSSETLNLESQIAQAQSWSNDATTVGSTTQPMYNAIGNMATNVTSLQSMISGALASPTPGSIVPQVQTLMTTLVGEMNTQVAGQYVFSGGNGNVPAVNGATNAQGLLTNYPSYYQDDNTPQTVRVSQQQTIQYGVLARNPAFSQALGAMQAAINSFSSPVGTTASPAATISETSATTPLGLNGTFSIDGGATVNVVTTDTLTDIMNNINAAAGSSGVSATLNGTSLSIAGANSTLTFANQSGNVLSSLGVSLTQAAPTAAQSTQILSQALTMAQQAETSLSDLQQTVATTSSQLQSLSQQQTTFVTYLQNSLSDVKDVNTGQVASEVSAYQTQLQASYMAVASVTKLSLAQFL